jgi:hypothetical protein
MLSTLLTVVHQATVATPDVKRHIGAEYLMFEFRPLEQQLIVILDYEFTSRPRHIAVVVSHESVPTIFVDIIEHKMGRRKAASAFALDLSTYMGKSSI